MPIQVVCPGPIELKASFFFEGDVVQQYDDVEIVDTFGPQIDATEAQAACAIAGAGDEGGDEPPIVATLRELYDHANWSSRESLIEAVGNELDGELRAALLDAAQTQNRTTFRDYVHATIEANSCGRPVHLDTESGFVDFSTPAMPPPLIDIADLLRV